MSFPPENVLLYSDEARGAELLARLRLLPGVACDEAPGGFVLRPAPLALRARLVTVRADAVDRLVRGEHVLFLLDLRTTAGEGATALERAAELRAIFARLGAVPVEERFGTDRVVALVSGGDDEDTDQLVALCGRLGIAHVVRDRAGPPADFPEGVVAAIRRALLERPPSRSALCLAGGAITGLFFEVGALKCVADCLPPRALNELDLYFGISAGAVVVSLLASGFSIDEVMAALSGEHGGRLPAMNLKLLRIANVDVRGALRRAGRAAREVGRTALDMARGRTAPSVAELFASYPDWVGAPLRPSAFTEALEGVFTQPGMTNDFRKLPRKLFVGATDQDLREAVLFGEAPHDRAPISDAVVASLSLNPAFTPAEVEGRYYTDGAVTRTCNFAAAIEKGADLVLVVDPFLPYVSRAPGFVRDRGLLYNLDQDVRTLSFTRFEQAREALLPRHPNVRMYTFLPANHTRRLLSENPMDHRPFLEIYRAAYLSTLRRLRHVEARLRQDLGTRGLSLSFERATAVSDRLARTARLTLADFYPDRRVEERRGERTGSLVSYEGGEPAIAAQRPVRAVG